MSASAPTRSSRWSTGCWRTPGPGRRRRPAQDRVARHRVGRAAARERATLLARLDEIAYAVADGDLTGPQAKRATERVNEKIADLDRRQQDQEPLRVFDGLPLGKPEVADAIEQLSPDRLRAVMKVL